MLKKMIKKSLPQGNLWNRLYSKLYHLSLWGMNYNQFENLHVSGESWTIRHIQKALETKKKGVIFDVGANKGSYTLILNEVFREGFQIYAFEPVAKTYKTLSKNTAGIDRIRPQHLGLAEKAGQQEIFFSSEFESQASLSHPAGSKSESEWILLNTVDNFCREHSILEIDFLKIDVEGNDLLVLKGSEDLIEKKKIRYIQFEFGGTNVSSRTFLKDYWALLSPHYDLFRILKNGLLPINHYDISLEIFQFSNYLAILR